MIYVIFLYIYIQNQTFYVMEKNHLLTIFLLKEDMGKLPEKYCTGCGGHIEEGFYIAALDIFFCPNCFFQNQEIEISEQQYMSQIKNYENMVMLLEAKKNWHISLN